MAASCNLDVIGEDGGCALTGGWQPGAFERPYMGFDARLLSTNSSLCSELIFSAHLMQISPTPQPREQVDVCEDPDNDPPEPSCAQFVDAVADSLALDKLCLICRTIDLYRRQFGLSPQWIADYAMLCTKTLAAPPCAVATVVAAFEFVYLMDKHYLRRGKTTLVGAFARRVLTLVDIQRHFFTRLLSHGRRGSPLRRVRDGPGGNGHGRPRYGGQSSIFKLLVFSAIVHESHVTDCGRRSIWRRRRVTGCAPRQTWSGQAGGWGRWGVWPQTTIYRGRADELEGVCKNDRLFWV